MDLYLPTGAQSQELSSRSLDRLPKTRSMDDLLSACDPGSLLTRTSSDPNLNNHCQEARVGLDPRLPRAEEEEEEPTAARELPGEEPPRTTEQQPWREGHPLDPTDRGKPSPQDRGLSRTVGGPSTGAEETSRACLEGLDGARPAPNAASGEKTPFSNSSQTEEPPERFPHGPTKDRPVIPESNGRRDLVETSCPAPSLQLEGPSQTRPVPGAPKEEAQPGGLKEEGPRRGSPRAGEEGGHLGKGPAEWWRKGVSQSQTSEFSLLGANWDSFQALGASLPGGDAGPPPPPPPPPLPRRLLSYYSCCNRRAGGRPFWATGLCLSGQWPSKDGGKPHGLARKPSKPWLTGPGKAAALGPKHGVLSSSSSSSSSPPPGAPPYLEDDGLPFPTDVIQHRLRQIEATYKQEVEQLRRQVRELQLRLDIRHCYPLPAEPPWTTRTTLLASRSPTAVKTRTLTTAKTASPKQAGSRWIKGKLRSRAGCPTTWLRTASTVIVSSGSPNAGITAGTVGMYFAPAVAT
ncbi:hypothetical protein JRQ81_008252 [Phrynocephalus forsythii]|uniref:Uncharacterized protein n=1 Tax=Phrynocephalus forsythii TaxID=171643 RepID=A0A9Q0XC21_9SAUR|nr:hypothetical protein JRQ81_008252 [Phrynocephalus forsythii]